MTALGRTWRTALRIPPRQLAARVAVLLERRLYAAWPEWPLREAAKAGRETVAAATLPRLPLSIVAPEGLQVVQARANSVLAGRFAFLHSTADYSAGVRWDDPQRSPLWRYQLQYLGTVLDLALAGHVGAAAAHLDSWRRVHAERWSADAWHPYPTSLRLANLCHAAAALGSFERLGADVIPLVAAHASYVLKHLEHDVRGNHLLENLRALLVASRFLAGPFSERCAAVALPLLERELVEQVLPDGAHFELSPMYHCIVLGRLLELQALALPFTVDLGGVIERMRGLLARVLCPDMDIPLLGDSARGFAPRALVLLGAHEREPTRGVDSLPDCGLHVFHGQGLWAIFDAGPVCPEYLPAHGQADSLTVEVWFGGQRIVGDPGVAEYTGSDRAWGRSTRAHSTVTVDDRDSSEVYGSFRVGGRARIAFVDAGPAYVRATLVPWGVDARVTRSVEFGDPMRRSLRILDEVQIRDGHIVRSRLHLAPDVSVSSTSGDALSLVVQGGGVQVRVAAGAPIRLEPGQSSSELGRVEATTILVQELSSRTGDTGVHGSWSLEPWP